MATKKSSAKVTAGFPAGEAGVREALAALKALATDKDGGVSGSAVSSPVQVVGASVGAPLAEGVRNVVKAGQVVPVKVAVGCAGSPLGGLAPTLTLLGGDVDPATAADDPAAVVASSSVSAADTAGVMREVAGGYLYNLKVPTAPAGSKFTVRVRPFGSGGFVQVVLEVR